MNPPAYKLDLKIETAAHKSEIRREILEKLRQFSREEHRRFSFEIRQQLMALETWKQADTTLIFHPLKSEPDLRELLENGERQIILPRVTGKTLELRRYTGTQSLRRASYGMLEPDPETCELVNPQMIDLAIVPGVAFDPQTKLRLGRGGGFYDRLLADPNFRAITIGVGFSLQLYQNLPTEPHDQALDEVVTA